MSVAYELNAPGGLSEERLNARAAILAAWTAYHRESTASITASMREFVGRYNRGALVVTPPEVRTLYPDLSRATLHRWYVAQQQGGVARLAPGYGNRKGTGVIDRQPDVMAIIVGEIVDRPHVRATHILQALRAKLAKRSDIELPCPRTLRAWVSNYKKENESILLAISNPDAHKNKFMVALGDAAAGVVRLNQRWELDSSPADVMLTDGRHCLIGVIDVFSRRVKLLVSSSSRSTAIGLLARRAILDWGVPESAVTDQGQDYVSVYLTRVWLDLGVEQRLCQKFSPEQKPFVERSFRTFAHDLVELLPGYIGHNVADRKAIESRRSFAQRLCRQGEPAELPLTAAQLQEFCDTWCDAVYARRPHEGLQGRTPFDVAAQWREPVRRVTDERALDVLLAEPADGGGRTVQKQGLRVQGAWFGSLDLPEPGSRVFVRLDPTNVGRVRVFSADGQRFLCEAVNLDRLDAGMSRGELAVRVKQRQRARIAQQKRELKLIARAADTKHTLDEILDTARTAAAQVVALPAPAAEHETPALAAATAAVAAREQAAQRQESAPPVAVAAVPQPSLVPAAELARRRAEVVARQSRRARTDCETPWAMAWWCAEAARAGQLDPADARWYADWRRQHPEKASRLDQTLDQRYGQVARAEAY